jgi:hypothetical protein
MALFVPLDVDYQSDPKIIAAGFYGEGLYNRALALSKRLRSDGYIDRLQLPTITLGMPVDNPMDVVARLVEVGLWEDVGSGWVIRAWLNHNAAADDIDDRTSKKKASSQLANHTRWHVGKGIVNPDCPLCCPTGIRPESESESIEVREGTAQQSDGSGSDPRCAAAIELHLDHKEATPRGVDDRAALRRTLERDHLAQLVAYVAAHPDCTATDAAEAILGTPRPKLALVPLLACTNTECIGGHLPSDPYSDDPARHTAAVPCPECNPSAARALGGSR